MLLLLALLLLLLLLLLALLMLLLCLLVRLWLLSLLLALGRLANESIVPVCSVIIGIAPGKHRPNGPLCVFALFLALHWWLGSKVIVGSAFECIHT
jgi:hypothetical protein